METELKKAVEAALKAFSALVDIPIIHADNSPSVKPTTDYLSVHTEALTPEHNKTGAGSARYGWLVQVLMAVRDGTGINKKVSFTDAVRENFPVGRKLESGGFLFQINSPAREVAPLVGDGWYKTPFKIEIRAIN